MRQWLSKKKVHKILLSASSSARPTPGPLQSASIAAQAEAAYVPGRNSLREVDIAAQAEAAYVPGRNSLRKVDGEAATVFMPLVCGKPWFELRRHGE